MIAIQQILVIGGMFLLSYLGLSLHSSDSSQSSATLYNEAVITGTGIAQSLMEEIQRKAFDEETVSGLGLIDSPDSLSLAMYLGPETGETSRTQFDDVDDYHNYTTTAAHDRLGDFQTAIKVYYIDKMSPNSHSFGRTFSKRVDIYVHTYMLKDTLKFINNVITY
jgi:hypothetical protein